MASVKNELPSDSSSPEDAQVSSQESSPTRSSPPDLHVVTDSANSSYQSSPLVTPDDPLHSNHLHLLRRGSLPVTSLNPNSESSPVGPPLVGHLDPFSRRRSVDASLHRLASNPYAPLARAKNGAVCAPRISGRSHRPGCVPEMPSATMPPYHIRHASADSRAFRISPTISGSPSPSPLSYYPNSIRASLPDNNLYAFSSRSVASPIPGPLPAPDFSFGAATSVASPCSADSERSSPDPFQGFGFRSPDDIDTEDDRTSASYDAFSRFGSIASIATDSSNTSAYYSDGPACEDPTQSRRESWYVSHL